jgi:hypothetical protein
MFLLPNDRKPRAHSRSRSRSRSRDPSRTPKAPSPPSIEEPPSRYDYPPEPQSSSAEYGYPSSTVTASPYEVRTPGGSARDRPPYPSQRPVDSTPYPPGDSYWNDFPPSERPGYVQPPDERQYRPSGDSDDDLAYGMPVKESREGSRHASYSTGYPQQPGYVAKPQETTSSAQYRYTPNNASGVSQYSSSSYQPPQKYQYAQPPENITYTSKPVTSQQYTQTPPQQDIRQNITRSYSQSNTSSSQRDAQYVEVKPDGLDPDRDPRKSKSKSKSHRLSVSNQQSQGLGPRMDRLSVSGDRPDLSGMAGGNLPPGSPMLEAYHGTYQQLSPMPSAMRLDSDSDLDDLQPLSYNPGNGHHPNDKLALASASSKKSSRRVVIYDPEADTATLASTLSSRKPSANPICDVLPPLTHDQMLSLRKEYKKQVKIQGKGINLSKHLKLKFPPSSSNFGKAAHVTSLGRWESEGYWANFWYQSASSRRELLIESLMGRSNADIRAIKDSFKDKRYGDSLTRCMEKELKMDKFRTAVLMVLEERRQEEQDIYPPEYRDRDVDVLAKSIRAREGGETAMLEIIVRRSDAHLREVLRVYQNLYGENFARAALQKSGNLVVSYRPSVCSSTYDRSTLS